MKVLIHLNHGSNKGFLLKLKENVFVADVKKIIEDYDRDGAITKLILRSSSMVELSPEDTKKAKPWADFTISGGYTVEKLA